MQMSTDSGPQRPDESDADYIRRMGRVSREQERIRRDAMRQDALDAEAFGERERHLDRDADKEYDQFLKDFTGGAGLDEIRKQYAAGKIHDPNIQKALADVKKASRGKATAARNRRTKKALKRHKGTLKAAGEQAKKNKNSCAVIAVALLGVAGGAGWAIYEAGSAIVSALGH